MIRTICIVAVILFVTVQSTVADSCSCRCCTGVGCTAILVGSPSISSCSSGPSCTSLCQSTYPTQCPADGKSGSFSFSCTGGPANNGNGQCIVSRVSSSPDVCVAPDNCAYKCSAGYNIGIVSTSASLTASSIPSGCTCATSSASVTGTTMSGSFTDGSTFTAGPTSNNQVQVITTIQGMQCTGIYKVTSGSCLGISSAATSSFGNSMRVVHVAAVITVVTLFFAA